MITTKCAPDGLVINTPITIDGPGARKSLRSAAGMSSRIFGIDGGRQSSPVSRLRTAATRFFSGGAIATSADLTLNSCWFDKNFTSADGGAIYNVGPLTLNKCTFSGNIANGGFGGAIHSFADSFAHGNVTAINCTYSGNRAVRWRRRQQQSQRSSRHHNPAQLYPSPATSPAWTGQTPATASSTKCCHPWPYPN